jgi:hypothetical protein
MLVVLYGMCQDIWVESPVSCVIHILHFSQKVALILHNLLGIVQVLLLICCPPRSHLKFS